MRAVAYSIRTFEKEPLAKANHKKHEITLISNALGLETAEYAAGKEVVIISERDVVTAEVIDRLAELGVKFVASRSAIMGQVDIQAAAKHNIKFSTVSSASIRDNAPTDMSMNIQQAANETITNLDHLQHDKCAGDSCTVAKDCGSHLIAGEMRANPKH